jgi:hypothetical protein
MPSTLSVHVVSQILQILFGKFGDAVPALLTRSRQMARNRNLRLHIAQLQRQIATMILRSRASTKLSSKQTARASELASLFNMYQRAVECLAVVFYPLLMASVQHGSEECRLQAAFRFCEKVVEDVRFIAEAVVDDIGNLILPYVG